MRNAAEFGCETPLFWERNCPRRRITLQMTTATESPETEREARLAQALRESSGRVELLGEEVVSLKEKVKALSTLTLNQAHEIKMLLRRLVGEKSEKMTTSDLQLVLSVVSEEDEAVKKLLAEAAAEKARAKQAEGGKNKPKPKGRRDLSALSLPREEVTVEDAELAQKGRVVSYDEQFRLMRIPGATKVLVVRTAQYEQVASGEKTVASAPPVKFLVKTMLHASYVAFLAVQKFCMGVPHYRLEKQLEASAPDGSVHRSVMSRSCEEHGNALGATIVRAMLEDAKTMPLLATDATGTLILPAKTGDQAPRGHCSRGHFFTLVAGTEHILFHYTQSHTQAAVKDMLAGFKGYLQCDASNVYDIFNHGPPNPDEAVVLVGCWAHCRRYFVDAALCHYPAAVTGLHFINLLFDEERKSRHLGPRDRHAARLTAVKPLAEAFFAWLDQERQKPDDRNLLTKALNYANNQRLELMRVFDDGRLELDNNRSERALRPTVVGRKNHLFFGSNDHAEAAAAFYSLIASCRLHKLDPDRYLDEVIRLVPYWPTDRFIELAPSRWRATRGRLDPAELARPAGHFTVPPSLLPRPARPNLPPQPPPHPNW